MNLKELYLKNSSRIHDKPVEFAEIVLLELRQEIVRSLRRSPIGEWGFGHWQGRKYIIKLVDKMLDRVDV